ncbi:MAG TPA: endonuclease/exonuclease/phosphatase family protein [Candidatus Saccharimonadales bacterium]|nr:endonuclease/exonuclease/phosphatase family protein [Candidatus Saccharimonadales bacterium]
MKVVFLNVWSGGKLADALAAFLRQQAPSTDIFCFQEAYDAFPVLAAEALGADFTALPITKKIISMHTERFEQALFYKPGTVRLLDSAVVLGGATDTGGLGQYVHCEVGGRELHLCNVHGLPLPGHKRDTPERLAQSRGFLDFMAGKRGPRIIGGDFNLFPDTESIQLFSRAGYRDLVAEFQVPTTRNRLAWERFPDNPQKFADFVFIDPALALQKFAVIDNEISDHLPLLLEVDL